MFRLYKKHKKFLKFENQDFNNKHRFILNNAYENYIC